MAKAAIYIRVSTEDQTEYSPDAQKRAILEYALKNSYDTDENLIFADEGISGRKAEKRPAFMQMISMAKLKPRPFDAILVHKFDRFARNREDSVVYKSLLRKEYGIKVISITEQLEDDKFSIILESMLEAMAEYYSLNLSDEVKKGMFEKARKGEHIGPAPYGYNCEKGVLIPHPYEKKVLQNIFSMYVYENYSLSAIVSALNAQGLTGKKGGRFTIKTIKYILSNPVYTGVSRYNYMSRGKNIPNNSEEIIYASGNYEKLVDPELFSLAQKKLVQVQQISCQNYNNRNLKSWAQKILICPHCKKPLTVSVSQKKYPIFRCSGKNRGACTYSKTISCRKAEKIIVNKLSEDFGPLFPLPFTLIKNIPQKGNTPYLFNQKIKEAEECLFRAKQAYLKGTDTLLEYHETKESLLKNIELYKSLLEKENIKSKKEEIKISSFEDIFFSHKFTIDEKQAFLKSFTEFIYID